MPHSIQQLGDIFSLLRLFASSQYRLLSILSLLLSVAACAPRQTIVIVITATPTILVPVTAPPTATADTVVATAPTQDVRVVQATSYTVQPGDTLSLIALRNNTTVEVLTSLNALLNPDVLEVGQILRLPATTTIATSDELLLPDQFLIRGPYTSAFNVAAFINQQPGYIRTITEMIGTDLTLYNASEIVQRVALEFSVDPRLLLATLEYRSGWLSQSNIAEPQNVYPIIDTLAADGVDRRGLYRQLAWTANQLNWGFYSWKYYGNQFITFPTGERITLGAALNAGTVGLRYLVSRFSAVNNWEADVRGLLATYQRLFALPELSTTDYTTEVSAEQPVFELPFRAGDIWFYTGGHHGGWGRGSAWGAIGFAPPDDRQPGSPSCYVSQFPITAVADGIIARSGDGTVILDLDGDGDETTGWTILYLHIATDGRIPAGSSVGTGDPIGFASCEGGVSNATHMHIARRYNGEWIPNTCDDCLQPRMPFPAFVMSGWSFYGLADQEYQGYATLDGNLIVAEQGRIETNNRIQRLQ